MIDEDRWVRVALTIATEVDPQNAKDDLLVARIYTSLYLLLTEEPHEQ